MLHCDFLLCLLGVNFFVQKLPEERKRPEVNQRVAYPIKDVLIRMDNALMISPLYNFAYLS